MAKTAPETPNNFIRHIIQDDIKNNKNAGKVATRFPPEPNGYLHIGHAKSICLNFGIAKDFDGTCNLRFDDTNPIKEDVEYVDAIKEDVNWLGFKWHGDIRYTSNYFEQLYQYALELIDQNKAFVCDLDNAQMREYRGTLTKAGTNSPCRDRSPAENRELFTAMKAGKFKDGLYTLRAKIDMNSPNMHLRDPILYRILHSQHHQTGNDWCIYPMYDYAHCISDALEGITHSLCTLEFEEHRPLYDWILDHISIECHPQQIEFARLALEYTIMSKRKLNELVTNKHVSGWDDPRMPTIAGMRRRGYTPASIREFCSRIGLTRVDTTIEMGVLESCIREDLDSHAPRAMAVLDPVKVVLTNYPNDKSEQLNASNHPKDESLGTRQLSFSHEVYIDRADFSEDPPKKYKRLIPSGEVRLRNSYVIKCEEVIKDPQTGIIEEIRCSYDADTLGKKPEGRKVKGVIHWVDAKHSQLAEVRLYDRLFNAANPAIADDVASENNTEKSSDSIATQLNPDSLKIMKNCRLELGLSADTSATVRYQFEREGYFVKDETLSTDELPVYNRIVTLRDTWAKIEKKQ